MYTKIQILANLSKYSEKEKLLIDKIIFNYKKGNLNSSYQEPITYFILKNIVLKNQCIKKEKSISLIFDKLQDIANKCQIKIVDLVKDESLVEFGIITENSLQIISENNNALIQE